MKRVLFSVMIFIALFSLTSCHWDIWGSTVVEYGKGTGTISTKMGFVGAAPTYVSATKAAYTDRIVITWNKVTGADYYEIYRSEDGKTFSKLTTNATDTESYEDENVVAGKTYQYKIRARSFSNIALLGDYSAVAYGNTLTAPANFTAAQGDSYDHINLKWDAVENVKGYKIYWSSTGYSEWAVLIPSGMTVTDYTFSANTAEVAFTPDKKYSGTPLYFYIVSVSNTGVVSENSAYRIGYTLVKGAPAEPKNFTASQGTSNSEITLSWDKMAPAEGGNYDWSIYRSAEGESETLIYSTSAGDIQPETVESRMKYTDQSSLKPGVEYTYKIIAIGDVTQDDGTKIKANGKPSETTGFLLSPPTKITEKKIVSGGFSFVFTDTLGAKENPTWSYTVLGRTNESSEWKELENYKIIPISESGEYTVSVTYSLTDGVEEHTYEYFSVRTNTNADYEYAVSKRYDEVVNRLGFYVPRPDTLEGFNASDNKVYDGQSASGGLYPIALTFSSDTTAVSFDIRYWTKYVTRADSEGYSEILNITADTLNEKTKIIRTSIRTGIGTKYYFAIKGKDSLGREGTWSTVDAGYSAITGNMLIKYMQIYCFKPWEYIDTSYLTTAYPYPYDINNKWKNSAIYGKIKQAGTGSLSDGITEKSYFNNGTIKYSAVVQGLGGRVTFSYNNFGEVEWMSTTGSYTMNVSMSGDGDASGALTVKGWYPASIGFGNISVKSQAFSGTYTVTQSNGLGAEEINPRQE